MRLKSLILARVIRPDVGKCFRTSFHCPIFPKHIGQLVVVEKRLVEEILCYRMCLCKNKVNKKWQLDMRPNRSNVSKYFTFFSLFHTLNQLSNRSFSNYALSLIIKFKFTAWWVIHFCYCLECSLQHLYTTVNNSSSLDIAPRQLRRHHSNKLCQVI